MTTKTFYKKLAKLIEDSSEFITDTIPMDKIKQNAKKYLAMDDVMYVAGEDPTQVFLLFIQKVDHE